MLSQFVFCILVPPPTSPGRTHKKGTGLQRAAALCPPEASSPSPSDPTPKNPFPTPTIPVKSPAHPHRKGQGPLAPPPPGPKCGQDGPAPGQPGTGQTPWPRNRRPRDPGHTRTGRRPREPTPPVPPRTGSPPWAEPGLPATPRPFADQATPARPARAPGTGPSHRPEPIRPGLRRPPRALTKHLPPPHIRNPT